MGGGSTWPSLNSPSLRQLLSMPSWVVPWTRLPLTAPVRRQAALREGAMTRTLTEHVRHVPLVFKTFSFNSSDNPSTCEMDMNYSYFCIYRNLKLGRSDLRKATAPAMSFISGTRIAVSPQSSPLLLLFFLPKTTLS